MRVDVPDFKEGKVKNRDTTGKMLISQGLKGNFYHLSLNCKNTAHFTILTPNTLSDFKIEPEKKTCFRLHHPP